MKLQIIILHYKELQGFVERILDSIYCQDFIDKSDLEVLLINDGKENLITEDLFKKYDFSIKYLIKDGGGISEARQFGQDYATADYIMFCDCDDLFSRIDALYKIFNLISQNKFDLIISSKLQDTNNKIEIVSAQSQLSKPDIHGKVYRRKFLVDFNINGKASIKTGGEDFYFNNLMSAYAPEIGYIQEPIYIGKSRVDSLTYRKNESRENSVLRELGIFDRYLDLLLELKNRNKINHFNNRLCSVMLLLYDMNVTYDNYKKVYNTSLQYAKQLAKLYSEEILTLNKNTVLNMIKELPMITNINYSCCSKTFVQWGREVDSKLIKGMES